MFFVSYDLKNFKFKYGTAKHFVKASCTELTLTSNENQTLETEFD